MELAASGLAGITTSQIEGEVLEQSSVQSSIRRQLGFAGDRRPEKPAEQGIAEMMVDAFRRFDTPLDEPTLCAWHEMVARGRTDLRDVGRYRSGDDPSSAQVAEQMSRFLEWFNRTAPRGPEPLPALTRAGMAHLYFESIHPFEDGNGRVGRVIAEKALTQSLGRPSLTALAATILTRRCEHTRQEAVLLRLLREGPTGFVGGVSAGKYITIAGTSPATATRDLADLVAKGGLVRTGERRHARYHLPIPVRPTPRVTITESGAVV